MSRHFRFLFVVLLVLSALEVAPERIGAEEKPAASDPRIGERPADFWTYQDFVEGNVPVPFEIRPGHPRLFITPENKGELVEKIHAAPGLWRQVIDNADSGRGEELVLACGAIGQLGLVEGFEYALSLEEYGSKGVAELMRFDYEKHRGKGTGNAGNAQLMLPCGYDWLHDLLTDVQKHELVEKMKALSGHREFVAGPLNCPGGQGMLLGLAFYGDGFDDAAAAEIVRHYHRDVWWKGGANLEGKPFMNLPVILKYLEGGGYTEGVCSYFGRNWAFYPLFSAWKTATGQDYYAHLGYFRRAPYWLAHAAVPKPSSTSGKSYSLPLHHYSCGRTFGTGRYSLMMAAATGYLKEIDPMGAKLARWWIDHAEGYENLSEEYGLIFGLLIGDPRVKGESPQTLGVSRAALFEGMGDVYLRSRWDDPDATVVGFCNSRFPMRAAGFGCFSLWKNGGGLFVYRGYTSRHDYWRQVGWRDGEAGDGPWAENNVIFYDRNRGLVLRKSTGVDVEAEPVGHIEFCSQPSRFDYIRGRYPQAYEEPVAEAERTVVYLRPAGPDAADHVVILDRVDSGSDAFTPHVVFNTPLEPTISKDWGRETDGRDIHEGLTLFENCPCVTITNEHDYDFGENAYRYQAHAKAFAKTLFPENTETLKIGGQEHFMDGLGGTGSDHGNFRTFRNSDRNTQIIRGGYWRYHVVPRGAGSRHTFLTAIEATDSKAQKPAALQLFHNDEILAARAGSDLVLFSKTGATMPAGAITIDCDDAVRILVCDLVPQETYSLSVGGERKQSYSSPAGTIFGDMRKPQAGQVIRFEISK